MALAVGSGGVVLRLDGEFSSVSQTPGDSDLGAVAVDVMDCEWATSLGQVFRRSSREGETWKRRWHDATWSAPCGRGSSTVGDARALR